MNIRELKEELFTQSIYSKQSEETKKLMNDLANALKLEVSTISEEDFDDFSKRIKYVVEYKKSWPEDRIGVTISPFNRRATIKIHSDKNKTLAKEIAEMAVGYWIGTLHGVYTVRMRIDIDKATNALFRTEGPAFNNNRSQFYINVSDLTIEDFQE